jgi:hypothetical protein
MEDRFLHILRFLHFADNNTDAYEKYNNPSEHLTIDEIIVKFKGRVVFRQYIPKNIKVRLYHDPVKSTSSLSL